MRYAANEKELLHLKTLVIKVFRLDSVDKLANEIKLLGKALICRSYFKNNPIASGICPNRETM